MAKISFIFVAIALTFSSNVLCQTDATYGEPFSNHFLTIFYCIFNLIYILAVSSSTPGYKIQGHVTKTHAGYQIPLTLNSAGKRTGIDTFGKTIKDLVIDVEYETAERLHVKISDKAKKQALVPDSPLGLERPKLSSYATNDANYDFQYTARPFSFKVIRKSDKTAIFDTTNMPLVFEDQYLELSTAVPTNANIYGFGEVTAPFKRSHVSTFALFLLNSQLIFYVSFTIECHYYFRS
jgi:alpha-glucosidase